MGQKISLGGAFLRAGDPETLYAWYEQHLGLRKSDGCFSFPEEAHRAYAVVAFFPHEFDYLPQSAMLNLQVEDVASMLAGLEAAGVSVDAHREHTSYGSFGWFTDPEGNRVELWQPASEKTYSPRL